MLRKLRARLTLLCAALCGLAVGLCLIYGKPLTGGNSFFHTAVSAALETDSTYALCVLCAVALRACGGIMDHDPGERAALETVRGFQKETSSQLAVIFNVYKDADLQIYRELLGTA